MCPDILYGIRNNIFLLREAGGIVGYNWDHNVKTLNNLFHVIVAHEQKLDLVLNS